MASVPLRVYRRLPNGGRERADDLPLAGVLNDLANPNQTAFEARELLVRSLDLSGNAFAAVESDNAGRVTAITPFPPSQVSVEQLASGRLRYRVSNRQGSRIVLQDDMLHVRGSSGDGVMGQSPISIARASVHLALSQAFAAQAYATGAMRPSAVISTNKSLSAPAKAELRAELDSVLRGPANAGRIAIVDQAMELKSADFNLADQEFLAARKLSNEDVCRIFGVPQGVVGVGDKATYASSSEEARSLVQNCLAPLAARVEQAMSRSLLTPEARRTFFIEHDLSELTRGDVQARFNAYRIGREVGALSANDIREREGLPPIANGDTYLQPLNLAPLGTVPGVPTGGSET